MPIELLVLHCMLNPDNVTHTLKFEVKGPENRFRAISVKLKAVERVIEVPDAS